MFFFLLFVCCEGGGDPRIEPQQIEEEGQLAMDWAEDLLCGEQCVIDFVLLINKNFRQR
jgi:hypothetical protein